MSQPSLNYRQALREAVRQLSQLPQAVAELEAALLLSHSLQVTRSHLLAWPEKRLTADQGRDYAALIRRRLNGEPIAHITGEREFWSLSLRITPETLIPRPETELLVERALTRMASMSTPRIADLGTGSGAIALALASERPDATIHATDRSQTSLAVARENATRLQLGGISYFLGDWCHALPTGKDYDLILSNPPYISADDPHLNQGDLPYEPTDALVSGEDGLADIRQIAAQTPDRLKAAGWLILEHGHIQGPAVRQILGQQGFAKIATLNDLAGLPRVTEGCFP